MQDLNDLFYFAEVVERGSFTAAGKSLGIPKSRLSRRIALLEERLGVRLLQRTTRQISLTSAGERYLTFCRAMAASARAADDAMHQLKAEPTGPVVVSCPVAIAQQMLAPILPEFMDAFPQVAIRLLVTNRRIDLIKEGVDLAVRVRAKLDTDAEFIVRRLGSGSSALVASPDYVRRHGQPDAPPALADHRTLTFSDEPDTRWTLSNRRGEQHIVSITPQLASNDFIVLTEAAIRGHGIALLPDVAIREALRTGKLVKVLPQWHTGSGIVHCIYPSRRGMVPAVRSFLDFLSDRLPQAYADEAQADDTQDAPTLA